MRRLWFALALLPSSLFAAIAHDVSTVNVSSASTVTCNFSHVAGTPTLALVFIGLDANETISGATYGGETLALVTTSGSATSSNDEKMHLYELHDPPSGTQTVDIDFSSDNHHVCIAQTFTGTDTADATVESTGYDNGGGACTGRSDVTLTMNSTASWMVTASVWQGGDLDPFTEFQYTTRDGNEGDTGTDSGTADDSYVHGDSTGDSGSLIHGTTPSAGDECGIVSVELVEPGAPSTRSRGHVIGAP